MNSAKYIETPLLKENLQILPTEKQEYSLIIRRLIFN